MNYFDASTVAQPYTDSQFTEELREKTAVILRNVFPNNPQKQQIKRTVQGFNIACPYCGDSATHSGKKRGNILLSGKWNGYYKCFNCNMFTKLPKFFMDFEQNLSLSGLKYVTEHQQDISSFSASTSDITADMFNKNLAMQWGIQREYFRNMLNLYEIDAIQSKIAKDYLRNRLQYQFRKFLYDMKNNYIIIMNLCDDRVIGFQMRSLNPETPKDRRFLTFNMDRMYKKILRSALVPPVELNTVSTLFGLYEINVYSPIIVVEGPMDSFLLPNAIATTGATKKLNIELPFWYMFDSDDTGNKYAIEKLKQKEKVFLWGKFKQDFNLPYKEKWDVNDVVLYLNGQGIRKIDWLSYFSNNPMDLFSLDSIGLRM